MSDFEDIYDLTTIICARILLRKLNDKERLNKDDFKILKIILEHYTKRGN